MALVCDPAMHVCVTKCTTDDDCASGLGGLCVEDGTCRPPCNMVDGGDGYCPDFNKLCLTRTGHCIDKCVADDQCLTIDPGTRCDEAVGRCINDAHTGCNFDTDCNSYLDPTDYCFVGGVQCYCGKDLADGGVCERRRRSCQECTDDRQCGNIPQFDPQGKCQTVTADTSGKKYCLFQANGPCTCGYVQNPMGYCEPAQGTTCANPGCTKDDDCNAGSVCNTSLCHCEARCRWDYEHQTLAAPGCPPNQTCWVDSANLDPSSIYYGSGRCKPPCSSDTDCTNTASNPQGGANLKCASEKTASGGMSDKRCRANGDCMDDLECPEQPPTSIYNGYCDRGTFVCKTDCRTGADPVTGKPYDDCRAPYGCASDGGTNFCKLKTCLESGGASIACYQGQYCCGEDKNDDGMADSCPPMSQLSDQRCYNAPVPPFCQMCMNDDDCKNPMDPSWLTCANGSKSPSCSLLPAMCFEYQNPQTGDKIGVCSPATYNDPRVDATGRRKDTKGCPSTFSAWYQRVTTTMTQGDDYCSSDSECNQGTDAGRCAPDPTLTLQDGGHPKACLCTVGAAVEQCPNTPDGGVFSFCKFGNNGETQACMHTVVCKAPSSYLFSDAGCNF